MDNDAIKWANAVNADPMPIQYTLDSICKLIDDDQKKANCNRALEGGEYCTKRLMNELGVVTSCEDIPADAACLWHMDCDGTDACVEYKCYETAQVNQYYHYGDKDWSPHMPPGWGGEVDLTCKYGEPFYVCKSAVPGAQEVRQYWHGGDRDWSPHFAPAWPGEEDLTGKYGEPFYAFSSSVPGAQEVRQYYHYGDKDWSPHLAPAWPGETDLTAKYGEPFYAFRKSDLTGNYDPCHYGASFSTLSTATIIV